MLKFFREIRQNLLMENKTGKYFKYAIGEIVLVVIGILIALQINNWNETKKQSKALDNIYKIVQSDLENDIEEMKDLIEFYEKRKPYYYKVGNGTITEQDYTACERCFRIFGGFPDLYLNKRGFNLLQNQQTATTDTLTLKVLDFYTKQVIELNIADKVLTKELKTIIEVMSTKPWWSEFTFKINSDGYKDYLINDPTSKNVVAYFISSIYGLQNRTFERFITEAEELIKELDNELMSQE